MREACTDLLIVDTQIAREDAEAAQYGRDEFWVGPRGLSAIREVEIDGRRYRGREYTEPPGTAWSALDNATSFWPTLPSLVNALLAADFTTVLEPTGPWLGWPPDRRVLVAKAGAERVRLRSTSLVVDDYPPVPEWRTTKAGARRCKFVDLRRRLELNVARLRGLASRVTSNR
jgi:hypothetical protein